MTEYPTIAVYGPCSFGESYTMTMFITQGNSYPDAIIDGEPRWSEPNPYGPHDIVLTTWVHDSIHDTDVSRSHLQIADARWGVVPYVSPS